MKYLNNKFYVEVKAKKSIFHPSEKNLLRERKEPKSLRHQCQVKNDTQIRKNQKVVTNENDKLGVKHYPKRKKL